MKWVGRAPFAGWKDNAYVKERDRLEDQEVCGRHNK